MTYRYDHFRRDHLRETVALGTGGEDSQVPEFDLPTTTGGRLRKSDLLGQRPVLVAFASLTDPVAASAAPALKRLYREHGSEVTFVGVYVREAHPGERIPQPRSMEWKTRHARMYVDRDGIPWTVAVDDLDGTFHRAMGGAAASAHLIDASGRVAFRTPLSNDERALRSALRAIRAGARPDGAGERRVVPALCALARYDDVVRAAGEQAIEDLRRETPLVYGAAEVAWVWRTLTPLGRLALAAVGGATAAALLGGVSFAARRRWV